MGMAPKSADELSLKSHYQSAVFVCVSVISLWWKHFRLIKVNQCQLKRVINITISLSFRTLIHQLTLINFKDPRQIKGLN